MSTTTVSTGASPDTRTGGAPVRLVIIGAGPAGIMVLERLLASQRRDYPELRLEIHLVDPFPPGGGRIWRHTQSPLLKLNTTLRDAAVFTDAACSIAGPIEPGPTFLEWVRLVRAGEIPRPDWSDALLEREIDTIAEADFPTRRLNSAYLSWAYQEVCARAATGVTITWHEDVALAVHHSGERTRTVRLRSGGELGADLVLHAVGHNGSEPAAESIRLSEFARRHGLDYVAPAFTADLDLSWVAPGADVIVRGMGLAATDLAVLLGEGRGGSFVREADGTLRYQPSGQEPVLHFGSRRGVPYRSKVTGTPVGEPVRLEYLGTDFRTALAQRVDPLDFERDIWPLVCAELLTGYYRELFTAHPTRVLGSWDSFARALHTIVRAGSDAAALHRFICSRVPNPDDRFEIAAFDRPLAVPELRSHCVAGRVTAESTGEPNERTDTPQNANVHDRVVAHIRRDLRQRTGADSGTAQALFLTMLFSYMSVAEIPAERWNARSRARELPKRWHTFFSYLASGPPGERLAELLALADAGVVRFLGSDVELELCAESSQFVALGAVRTTDGWHRSRVTAATLIDAWLPQAQAAHSDNPLLRQLVRDGMAAELRLVDPEYQGSTGQIVVHADGSLPNDPRQFALGAFTSLPVAGAFARPGIDALPFRVHDRCARAILAAAAASVGEAVASRNITITNVTH